MFCEALCATDPERCPIYNTHHGDDSDDDYAEYLAINFAYQNYQTYLRIMLRAYHAETPEGQACGPVKNLALMVYIPVGSAAYPILEFLEEWGIENYEKILPNVIPQATKNFLNGCWFGIHRNPEMLVTTLKQLRRRVNVNTEVGVVRDVRLQELRIHSDYGRCSHPLFIVDKQRLLIKNGHIQALQHRGCIEYIGTEEEETTMIPTTINDPLMQDLIPVRLIQILTLTKSEHIGSLPRHLESEGISAFCFGFSGSGECEGPFYYVNYWSGVEDLRAVVNTSIGSSTVTVVWSEYEWQNKIAELGGKFWPPTNKVVFGDLSDNAYAIRNARVKGKKCIFLTLDCTADAVYRACFEQVQIQNDKYYTRFPEDVETVREVVKHLAESDGGGVSLPSGGILTPKGLQLLGLNALGSSTGFENLHYMFERVWGPVVVPGAPKRISYYFLSSYERRLGFDTNPLYALMHESIYCEFLKIQKGDSSSWAAHRVRVDNDGQFDAITAANEERPVMFTGEMIFPWLFDEIQAFRPFKDAAELLAEKKDWPPLYDIDTLNNKKVSVAAAVYYDDLYVNVNFKLVTETASKTAGIKLWITNEYMHAGLRDAGSQVLDHLFGMLSRKKPLF